MSGGHLVHGMGTALETPTWPVITGAEARAALSHFPEAGHPITLTWHSPRPFSAATLIETDRGACFLKRHHYRVRTPAALADEHRFMTHLHGQGLSVPEVVRTADGDGAVALGEWSYELHRNAPGVDLYRDRQSWTPFLNPGHAHAAGVAMARLHRASRDFMADARDSHPLIASFDILPAPDPLTAAQAYIAARPALQDWLADRPWRQELDRLFSTFGAGLAPLLQRQASLWTHNDWHPSNLLWDGSGTVSTIFDFGLSTRTCALHDLAIAIERTAIRWLDMKQNPAEGLGDANAALALLAGYRSKLPLTRDDIAVLMRLLPLVHVEFALSEIDYFAGVVRDTDQAAIAWQDYLIDHADWFAHPAGRAFLQQIEREAQL